MGPIDDDDEEKRLRDEVFSTFRRLHEGGRSIEEIRNALKFSFMLSSSPEQRESYDAWRIELDAFLQSLGDGEAVIRPPEGFVASPEVSASEIEALACKALASIDKH